jgi:hypothetical protein
MNITVITFINLIYAFQNIVHILTALPYYVLFYRYPDLNRKYGLKKYQNTVLYTFKYVYAIVCLKFSKP